MEPQMKIRIEEVVREILEESDMETTTEHQIRKKASENLGLDLNEPKYKAFVRHVVNNFLEEQRAKEEALEEGGSNKEYDDDGDLIVCRVRFIIFSPNLSNFLVRFKFFLIFQSSSNDSFKLDPEFLCLSNWPPHASASTSLSNWMIKTDIYALNFIGIFRFHLGRRRGICLV